MPQDVAGTSASRNLRHWPGMEERANDVIPVHVAHVLHAPITWLIKWVGFTTIHHPLS
jgi:hypothetical protein